MEFKNQWFNAKVGPKGSFSIWNQGGEKPILNSIEVIGEWRINERIHKSSQVPVLVSCESEAFTSFVLACTNSFCKTKVAIRCKPDSPRIDFIITSNILEKVEVLRYALLGSFAKTLSAVVGKNRKINKSGLSSRLWLDKQGAIWGSGVNSAFIYHAPDISSLEVDGSKDRLIVNMDYYKDHPQVMSDRQGGFIDRSCSYYLGGEEITSRFSIYFGYTPPLFLRLMTAPNGYLATHVWTEHACHSDLRVHRALYYGSEVIDRPEKAKSGFVKHKIPVTKSVFYDNPQSLQNEDPDSVFINPMVSIKGSPGFAKHLDEIYKLGIYDICLHCAHPQSSSRGDNEEALNYMRDHFQSASWIDHLWYRSNNYTGCKESFACEGLDSNSDHDMRLLWCRYGIKYFWGYSVEILKTRSPWHWENRFTYGSAVVKMLKKGDIIKMFLFTLYKIRTKLMGPQKIKKDLNILSRPDGEPNPIYWVHPTLGKYHHDETLGSGCNFYSWATRGSYFPGDEEEESYTKDKVDKLINEWGICIAHAYPTSVYRGSRNKAWFINHKGEVEISDSFEDILANMAKLRDSNMLYLTTIRQIMDYWIKMEGIEIEYVPSNDTIRIHNYNQETINGLSFVTEKSNVYVNGAVPQKKIYNDECIFWFDLAPKSIATISSNEGSK